MLLRFTSVRTGRKPGFELWLYCRLRVRVDLVSCVWRVCPTRVSARGTSVDRTGPVGESAKPLARRTGRPAHVRERGREAVGRALDRASMYVRGVFRLGAAPV